MLGDRPPARRASGRAQLLTVVLVLLVVVVALWLLTR